MREHAAHTPQASRPSSSPNTAGARQLSACARAIAISRAPELAGPEKIRLGGSASRPADLASRAARRRLPCAATTSLKGMAYSTSDLLLAPCCLLLAPCSLLLAPCSLRLAACGLRLAACS